eukprot:CAMPEP_0173470394 /NCGR_PEP_ID=MMETSP1357-20121228/77851_1 /TAXON_ID=77926 /ORGANISM="Hemiselmis rufescens, Strain PCC563" /LENGTH=4076 /DNA_ID=CAMNT_0014438669 /DNA_START=54 /DNA_END=12284 /DNA_ORIENTATION=+
MQSRRAVKCLVALACSLAAIGMASAVGSHMVNYRGQPQEDLTCMQASTAVSGETVVYRNDPSTNCFGFPSLQFDTVPVEGGSPNGMTIDWSLMVDELQMQDDDRLHFHLPGFTGGHNTFGIMGSSIDDGVNSQSFTPNFDSLTATDDLTTPLALRADFGALVGIWGISCGTEKNLYMDRAKVDNLLTAEWDPAREMLKVVIKGQRYANGGTGRHDGYVGTRSDEFAAVASQGAAGMWMSAGSGGLSIPASASSTDPQVDTDYDFAVPADGLLDIKKNDQSFRGHHLQAMEYAGEGPREGVLNPTKDLSMGTTMTLAATTHYKNDGYIYAPGNRVCGIYIDPSKLYIGQVASNRPNGLGPLPPYGGIGKNWYKLAYMRRFRNSQCQGGVVRADGKFSRPGMNPETCTMQVDQDLSKFWQVPFDGDTERIVGYQFTTTTQMLPVAKGAKPAGTLQKPTFSYAQAKGKTTGMGSDNCITVSLIPSVTIMSGSAQSQITLEGLVGSGTSDTDTLELYSNSKCTSTYRTLAGSDGQPTKNFAPVAGTAAHGTPDTDVLHNYRPFGRAMLQTDGLTYKRMNNQLGGAGSGQAGISGSDGYYDDVDWHTRARTGTTSAITTGNPNQDTTTASALQAAGGMISSKLSSPVGDLTTGNGRAKFEKDAGKLTVNLSPGYFLQAGELLVMSFKLQNGNAVQESQDLTVSASGTYCDSDNGFCDGVADKSLSIDKVPVTGKGKMLEAANPKFTTATIFQSSSDPDDLTTLFVTLATNVALKKPDTTSDAKITIKGLCGFETGTDVTLYQNQKSGGMHEDGGWPVEAVRSVNDLPGLSSDDNGLINYKASFDADGTLKINLGTTGLTADTDYAFAFQMQTKKVANAACTPTISSSGGSETIVAQDMDASNVGLVKEPMFTTIKIGQVTTRPAVANYLCVTLQHNYQFYSDAVVNTAQGATGNYVESKITISGLTGTQAVSTVGTSSSGYALAYCPTEVPNFDDKTTQHTSTQFQPDVTAFTPKRYATFQTTCFGDSLANQKCIPGNPYVPSDAFDTKPSGRSWFGGQSIDKDSFTWDQATGTAVLTVDADITKERMTEPQTVYGGIPKNSEIVFALPLQNGVEESDCKTVSFEASGRIAQKATFVQTKTGKAIQDGEKDGDACALMVYAPGFLVKKITQSTAATGEDNTMTVSLRSNVDLSSVASGQASYITISGLTGTATGDGDLGVTAPAWRFSPKFEGGEGPWVQGTGTLTLKIDAQGACVPPTVWAAGEFYDGSATQKAPFALGGSDAVSTSIQTHTGDTTLTDQVTGYKTGGKIGTTMPSNCIKAGYLYVFTFQVTNPSSEQAAPSVMIEGKYRDSDNTEKDIAKKAMDAPISDDSDKTAMFVSDQILTKYKIGQLIPAPGSINVICVTLTTSKDIKSQPNAPPSSITLTGLTGYDASAQDLQLYKDDGVTTVSTTGGDPASDAYAVGGIFSSNNEASESSATTSGRGWAKYDGSTAGNIVMWVQSETATSGIYSYMQKNVDHKFCFRLKNPKTEMSCKDVSVVVDNKGTVSSVKATQDLSNSIEDYKFGSTCAGYVAPPNFVIKNWRSSSNSTTNTAIIHMELATNLELETGDFITVSGLTSYTKACATPPCDVGIDVTRTAVAYLHGKPYINGVRNVKGYGLSDTGASSAERVTFAKAIQSYDLTGQNDDGSKTSTFGDNAAWGKVGDTEASASTLTFTVAKSATMDPADISNTISSQTAPTEHVLYEIVFTLTNKAAEAMTAPTISINIGQGQTQYVSLPMNTGQEQPKMGITKVGNGGMEISYTPMKAVYGGESLILTLPKFTRDSNGMLFGITSAPNDAFETYKTLQDWKAYGTDESYARAFFTNGWTADGISAKSGDSGQTGERWNYPNVNAKVTTDADYSRDTGVLVLDINDPGAGMNKNYWYAATEDNLYEGRVTRAANLGAARVSHTVQDAFSTMERSQVPLTATGSSASVDYYLDNGEELKPVRAFEHSAEATQLSTSLTSNGFTRPASYMPLTGSAADKGQIIDMAKVNIYPLPVPTTVDTIADDIAGTPPFMGIPAKYQPSRRDNFYKGMLMKCWVGTAAVGGRLPYTEATATGQDNYAAKLTTRKELLPPPENNAQSTYGSVLTPTTVNTAASTYNFAPWSRASIVDTAVFGTAPTANAADGNGARNSVQGQMTANLIKDATAISKADVSRTLETRVIQASYRQIDYIPRKSGGCRFTGTLQRGRVSTTLAAPTAAAPDRYQLTLSTTSGNGFKVGQSVWTEDANTNYLTGSTDGSPLSLANDHEAEITANTWVYALDQPSTLGAVGCQDEVPGYPAVVRIESPFSRPLDPDTLCYIQRKADVGVYTGMTAMVGHQEYTIKQGAANVYTVGFVAADIEGPNGDPVDRKVPRSYSTEGTGIGSNGMRTAAFFADGAGLSGQPYTIYSQLELVAKEGSKVSRGETVTITIPDAVAIMPPSDLEGAITPVNTDDVISDKIKISHVLLVPLSPACSIVAGYGVASGCQDNNGKGGVFDLILSDKWPYAYTSANGNDLTGYPMTVFGGQSTVIKTMADKYSQDLPYKPLEGLNTDTTGANTPLFTTVAVLDVYADTLRSSATGQHGGRAQTNQGDDGRPATTLQSTAGAFVSGPSSANSKIDTTFTVAKELDLMTLTGGTSRADSAKMPKVPNSPITVTDGACGNKVSDTLGPSTLPYAVCLSLGGSLAHNQNLSPYDSVLTVFANGAVGSTGGQALVDNNGQAVNKDATAVTFTWGRNTQTVTLLTAVGGGLTDTLRPGMIISLDPALATEVIGRVEEVLTPKTFRMTRLLPNFDMEVTAVATGAASTAIRVIFPGPSMDQNDKVSDGVQKITGEVGLEATPVMPGPINDNYAKMGSMRPVPNYGTMTGTYENPADNLGLGAYIVVGVYTNGTSDRFVFSTQGNKGTTKMALPIETDMESNLVIQRYLGTSRSAVPLADIPAGLIGGDNTNKPAAGYAKPAGQVPRFQARVAAGYAIGRFSYGVDNIMQVRSDLTAGAYPTGLGYSPYSVVLNPKLFNGATAAAESTTWANTATGEANLRPPEVVSPVNMDGAIPMSPASMSSDLNGDFNLGTRTGVDVAATANDILVPAESIRLNDETLMPMNRHPSGHSLEVTAPSTMQKVRFGRSTLPLPQVFHTAEHQASSTLQTNVLSRGHCGLHGRTAFPANALADAVALALPSRGDSAEAGVGTSLAVANLETCTTSKTVEFNPDLPFSRNVYIEQGMDVYLVSSLFDSLIQRPEPIRKIATGRTEEGRRQTGCGMGTGYYAGNDQNPLTKYDTVRETAVTLTSLTEVNGGRESSGQAEAPNTLFTTAANLLQTPGNDIRAGDIIYLSGAGAAASAVLATEAMLVTEMTSATTFKVERGFLGSTVAAVVAGNVVYVRNCGGGAFPMATSPPILKRSVARGTHATDDEVLGNLQTSGTRRPRSETPFAPTKANSKGQSLDNPVNGANYNYGFDVDTRLYSVLGPFMRPAVIRDVTDSGKIPSVKTSQFPGVLTIADQTSSTYMPAGSNVPTRHGFQLSNSVGGTPVAIASGAGTAVVLDGANDRMMDKGCTTQNPCVISIALNGARRLDLFLEVTAVTQDGLTLTVQATDDTSFGQTVASTPVVGDKVTYYPGYKKLTGTVSAIAANNGVALTVIGSAATTTNTALGLNSQVDDLSALALPFFVRVRTEYMKVTSVFTDATTATVQVLTVERGALGSTAIATIAAADTVWLVKMPVEDRNNNVKYSLAPIKGTTFATAQTRDTEYNTYQETDKIITFCNPLQSDLNNAPGAVIMNAITDDAVFVTGTAQNDHSVSNTDEIVNSAWTRTGLTDTTFASSNGQESTAPSMWTVPRRHHLCRKLITGAPEVSTVDVASDVYATDNGEMYARSRYTESIQMNTVLNQEPSPNMRAMVTFVEPTKIPVVPAPPTEPVPEPVAPPATPTATPSPYDPIPAIVGGVLGGFFGLLLIGALIWYLCCRKPAPEPVGRAVAMADKPLAPVYLPQPYPSLPEQYVPAPMPAYPVTEVVQPTGQPMLYSSYQAAPVMEAYPPQPGAYPAPYGVVPQPAYGI